MNAHGVVGESPAMLRLYDQVKRAGANKRYVLILGEPGTGKELVARAIHRNSPRSDRVFLPINCASIPGETMESQMFGYEKGAFTGAVSRRIGWVEVAKGGTLFLDEIGDMPLALQPKLLRFLQEQEFMRLGGSEVLRSDVRIVAATNRDLQGMVQAGLFREDLLNRLEVFTIKVPPLRERPTDILPLAWYFIRKNADLRQVQVTRMAPEVQRLLCECSWPGNVRRLENAIIHALGNGDPESATIIIESLPDWIRGPRPRAVLGPDPSVGGRKKITREDAIEALNQTGGHHEKAARLLGISRAQLFRLKKKFAI
jgi:transcriptional regulator with GAF, ATPase, and Fis domain